MTKVSTELEIIECLPVVVFSYIMRHDGSMDFTYVSPTCEKILGLPAQEVLLGDREIEEYIHPEDWSAFKFARGRKKNAVRFQLGRPPAHGQTRSMDIGHGQANNGR